MNDRRTPPPDDKGRLWRTTDGGQTWTSIVGADPAHRLPERARSTSSSTIRSRRRRSTPAPTSACTSRPTTARRGIAWATASRWSRCATSTSRRTRTSSASRRTAAGCGRSIRARRANQGAPGNGDYDRNLRIDWIDRRRDVGAARRDAGDDDAAVLLVDPRHDRRPAIHRSQRSTTTISPRSSASSEVTREPPDLARSLVLRRVR